MGKGKEVLFIFAREARSMLKTEKEECQKDQAVGERGKGEEKMKKERWEGEGSKLLVILSGIHSN